MRICVVGEMVYYYIIRFMADHVKCNFRDGLLKLCCILYLDVFCFVFVCLFFVLGVVKPMQNGL